MTFSFKLLIACALLNLGICATGSAAENPPRRPNIILMMADDMGYECLGANGSETYYTPTLDKMAAEGVRFTHCYSQPLCTPSRVKIMTGLSNVRNYVKFGVLDRSQTTFAHLVKKQGYATCIVGKWQLGTEKDSPKHFGFDENCLWQHWRPKGRISKDGKRGGDNRYFNPQLEINGEEKDFDNGEYGPDVVSDYACDFMRRNKDKPFLVYYPMILTHSPMMGAPPAEIADPAIARKVNKSRFTQMVTHTDKIVKKIWDTVIEIGQEENTLILFTGDNGTGGAKSILNGRRVAGGKGKMTDAGTRVPLVAYWKGTAAKGLVSDALVDFSDMLPTFCDAAGADLPEVTDGLSFLPQLKGNEGNPRDYVHIWYLDKQGKVAQFARTQTYKLYKTGKFYNIEKDVLEKAPISTPTDAENKVKAMLQEALDKYSKLRLTHVEKTKE